MNRRLHFCWRALPLLLMSVASGRASVIIDYFSSPSGGTTDSIQATTGSATNTTFLTDIFNGLTEVIGGTRVIAIQREDYTDPEFGFTNSTGSVTASVKTAQRVGSFSSDDLTVGRGSFIYDGGFGSISHTDNSYTLNPTGLYQGGVGKDLTENGIDNALKLTFSADLAGAFTANIFTDGSHYSSYTYSFSGGGQFTTVLLPFASFVPSGSSGGANFTNVGAIQIFINSLTGATPSLDASFRFLQSDFVAPEPGTYGLVGTALAALAWMRRKKS